MTNNTDLFGDTFGFHYKATTLDAIVARFVPTTDFSLYPELVGRKWFGYRDLSPGQSLFLFIDRFSKEFKRLVHTNWGKIVSKNSKGKYTSWDRAPIFIKPISWRNFQIGTMRSFWNAMCHADNSGIPYDFYCRTVIEIAAEEGWAGAPSPNQLYHPRLVARVELSWERHLSEVTVFTAHPFFKAPAFEDHPWQIEYAEYLCSMIRKRGNLSAALGQAMIQKQALPAAYAAKRFGTFAVKDALAVAQR